MKKYFTFLLLVGAVSIALIALADNTPADKNQTPSADVRALKNEITELKARVQALEAQTKTLESTVTTLQQPRMIPLRNQQNKSLLFNTAPPESQPPKVWGKKEVNGWTYYIVPCEQGQ